MMERREFLSIGAGTVLASVLPDISFGGAPTVELTLDSNLTDKYWHWYTNLTERDYLGQSYEVFSCYYANRSISEDGAFYIVLVNDKNLIKMRNWCDVSAIECFRVVNRSLNTIEYKNEEDILKMVAPGWVGGLKLQAFMVEHLVTRAITIPGPQKLTVLPQYEDFKKLDFSNLEGSYQKLTGLPGPVQTRGESQELRELRAMITECEQKLRVLGGFKC